MISWFPFLCLVNKMIKLVLWISITSIFDCSLVSMKTAFSRNSHPKVFLGKGVSENMQQLCRRTSMRKCDFNKVSQQLYWNRTLAWLFLWMAASDFPRVWLKSCSIVVRAVAWCNFRLNDAMLLGSTWDFTAG